ncbi:MAG TPA: hypothetical protein DCS24_04220 [Erythrobacter sp.]|nr:hypothetical protein [Erythrobacter sp.]
MPYKYGHYFVGLVLLVILGGFWATYFSTIGNVPLAFHVHAITSLMWLSLLIVQHVSIHRRANDFHKQMGKASFVLFPFLIFGFVMIINMSAQSYAAQESEFITYIGSAFGSGMLVAIAAYLTLYYLALKNRRNVKLHAGYMLATPVILFESPFGRLMDQYFPWLNFIRTDGLHGLLSTIAFSNALMIVFVMVLYFRDRRHGAPWLVAAAFMTTQSVVMWFAPSIAIFDRMFAVYATIPTALTLAAGLGAGALAGWLGWRAGSPPAKPATALA